MFDNYTRPPFLINIQIVYQYHQLHLNSSLEYKIIHISKYLYNYNMQI